jgi:ppGpp synthetase/RelA/SpoT-type nucleotidyltranferase
VLQAPTQNRFREANLDKTKKQLIDNLKSNTENRFYNSLLQYLDLRVEEVKTELVQETDMDNVKRLQGRGKELEEFRTSLVRKKLKPQVTGSFG